MTKSGYRLLWCLTIPLLAFSLCITFALVPHFVHEPILKYEPLILPSLLKLIRGLEGEKSLPEPIEQARYLLALGLGFGWLALSAALTARQPKFLENLKSRAWLIWGLVVQLVLTAFIVAMWVYQDRFVHSFFNKWALLRGTFALAIVCLVYFKRQAIRNHFTHSPSPIWSHLIAALSSAAALSVAFFRESSFSRVIIENSTNISPTLAEFAAVLNGRTPKVDYFPQYQTLLAYLVAPLFRVFGLSITTFSLLMAGLSFIGLMLLYVVLRRFTGRTWGALALYLSFLGIAAFRITSVHNQVYSVFTYYGAAPLRYFGPWLLCFLLTSYFLKPRISRALGLFYIGGLVAMNNLDFGIAALGAAWLAVLIAGPQKQRLPNTLSLLAGSVGAILTFLAVTWLRSGEVPSWYGFSLFQRIFAVYGFMTRSMADFGLHWLIYLTLLGSIASGFLGVASGNRKPLQNGVLIYSGIFGLGASAYFVSRSHWQVLQLLFPLWWFALVLLLARMLSKVQQGEKDGHKLSWIPLSWLAAAFALSMTVLPGVVREAFVHEHLKAENAPPPAPVPQAPTFAQLQAMIQKYAQPKERVGILYFFGYMLALRADVVNVYPFAEHETVLIFDQLDTIMSAFEKNKVTRIFGRLRPELKERVMSAGFRMVDHDQDFEVWVKE